MTDTATIATELLVALEAVMADALGDPMCLFCFGLQPSHEEGCPVPAALAAIKKAGGTE